MHIAKAMAVAAAALVTGLYPLASGCGAASAREAAVKSEAMTRQAIRAAALELADLMEQSYVFPDQARRYAAHLRARVAAGAYDAMVEPALLAGALQDELRAVHGDAHLRITLAEADPSRAPARAAPEEAFAQMQWLAQGIAYLRLNRLPGDEDSAVRMGQMLAAYESAQSLIIDVRTCPGGGLSVMDALLARLYGRPTFVMTMDTRSGANPRLEQAFNETPTLRRVEAPEGITRYQHWTQPVSPASALADARVFVLTGRTASACEHLVQALRETGRATLVGSNTRGAGHYGVDRSFGAGRFEIFLPTGLSYAPGAQSWEGQGVAPHRQAAPQDALTLVLRELGADENAATRASAQQASPAKHAAKLRAGPN